MQSNVAQTTTTAREKTHYHPGSIAAVLFVVSCLLPPVASWFEGSMSRHMLMQFPLLAITGAYLARQHTSLLKPLIKYDAVGATSLVFGTGTMLFWMIPLHLDLATIDPLFRLLKAVSIPVGIGLCFFWALHRSNVLMKLVISFEAWAAVTRLGWIYVESPEQLCSSYLIGEQQTVGTLLLGFSTTAAIAATAWGLFGRFTNESEPIQNPLHTAQPPTESGRLLHTRADVR